MPNQWLTHSPRWRRQESITRITSRRMSRAKWMNKQTIGSMEQWMNHWSNEWIMTNPTMNEELINQPIRTKSIDRWWHPSSMLYGPRGFALSAMHSRSPDCWLTLASALAAACAWVGGWMGLRVTRSVARQEPARGRLGGDRWSASLKERIASAAPPSCPWKAEQHKQRMPLQNKEIRKAYLRSKALRAHPHLQETRNKQTSKQTKTKKTQST